MSDDHAEGPIRTPRQLAVAVVLGFAVPVLTILMLATFVSSGSKPGAGSSAYTAEAVAARLQPVGSIVLQSAAPAAAGGRSGEAVVQAQCAACHGSGAAGAPKIGDTAAWAPRIKTGYAALLASALKGKGAMPPQGGAALSDIEIGRAVVYLANQGGARFDEPKAK